MYENDVGNVRAGREDAENRQRRCGESLLIWRDVTE